MAGTPFLAEIRIFPFDFAPRGWAMCNGSLLQIAQNQALYSLLGTRYGGNGQTTFALPDLKGRVAMHQGFMSPGTRGGEAAHTITIQELPAHVHTLSATNSIGDQFVPGGNLLANVAANVYAPPGALQSLAPDSIANVGGSQPHNNLSPYMKLCVCISLQGFFPSVS